MSLTSYRAAPSRDLEDSICVGGCGLARESFENFLACQRNQGIYELRMNFYVTGTDTAVGKTFFTSLLVRTLRQAGNDVVGMKPIVCGERDDAEILFRANDATCDMNLVNPLWLRPMLSPYTALMIENRPFDPTTINEAFQTLAANHEHVIVEGAGGWKVPVTKIYEMPDFVIEHQLPVILVVMNRLGAINHTLLSLESIRASGCQCVGYVLNQGSLMNDAATLTNSGILQDLLNVPLIAEITYGQGAPLSSLVDWFHKISTGPSDSADKI